MSEEFFDAQIRKNQAQDVPTGAIGKGENKKRNSVVDSDEEPVSKRRKGSESNGLSPIRLHGIL